MAANRLIHNVFFTLNDSSAEAIEAMVADCRQYLAGIPGITFFAAGERASEYARPVNDSEFHVALTVGFDDKADHDAYQKNQSHLDFIEKNKANWKQVRVFDAFSA